MLPEHVGSDACRLAQRWGLDIGLANRLVQLEEWAHQQFEVMGVSVWPGIRIISGQRSAEKNAAVGGVPNSFHVRCPSLAADLRVGNVAGLESPEVMAILGGRWRLSGGRWGGTFRDPSPSHFDIG